MSAFWKHSMLGLCGVKRVYREAIDIVAPSSAGQRQAWLAKVGGRKAPYFSPLTARGKTTSVLWA